MMRGSARHGVDCGQVDLSAALLRVFGRLGWVSGARWPSLARAAQAPGRRCRRPGPGSRSRPRAGAGTGRESPVPMGVARTMPGGSVVRPPAPPLVRPMPTVRLTGLRSTVVSAGHRGAVSAPLAANSSYTAREMTAPDGHDCVSCCHRCQWQQETSAGGAGSGGATGLARGVRRRSWPPCPLRRLWLLRRPCRCRRGPGCAWRAPRSPWVPGSAGRRCGLWLRSRRPSRGWAG